MRFFISIFLFYQCVSSRELLSLEPVVKKLTDKTSLTWLTAGVISTLAVQPYDERIRSDWKNYQQMSPATADIGNFLGSGIAGVVIIGGQYLLDSNEEGWKSHARALIWDSATVFIMKYSFGKQRPGNSSSYQSFPSGHTATAFATATSLTFAYGWKAAVIAYPVAVFVGASRWSDDMHWGSDVLAGAFVGTLVARACVAELVDDGPKSTARFWPIISPDFKGLNYSYSF